MEWFNPSVTYQVLLVVQALHLLHHRIAKRHISFVEVLTAVVLCFPPSILNHFAISVVHIALMLIQIVGSIWIKKLSPSYD